MDIWCHRNNRLSFVLHIDVIDVIECVRVKIEHCAHIVLLIHPKSVFEPKLTLHCNADEGKLV